MGVRKGQRHRRDWRRFWRYCRCGLRWRCPDTADVVPMPYAPDVPPLDQTTFRASVRAAQTEVAITRAADENRAKTRPPNQRPRWDAPTRSLLGNGRAGRLTPGQADRARYGEVRHKKRAGRV